VVANDGKEGVDIVFERKNSGKEPFDLIFMDIHMPIMDGLEASAKITELGVNMPIVALTANIMSHDLKLYKDSGMVDYLGKPFTSQELWQCLVKYFDVVSVTNIDVKKLSYEDEKLLQQTRLSFVKNNQDTFVKIKLAVDSGDVKTAHRIAHTLKSNAAQIGKEALRKIAAEIEDTLSSEGNLLTSQQIDTLETELKSVLSELAPLLNEFNSKIIEEITDKGKILEIIGRLEPLLVAKNPECEDMLDEIRAIQKSEELVKFIENFNFKRAHEELLKLKEMLEL